MWDLANVDIYFPLPKLWREYLLSKCQLCIHIYHVEEMEKFLIHLIVLLNTYLLGECVYFFSVNMAEGKSEDSWGVCTVCSSSMPYCTCEETLLNKAIDREDIKDIKSLIPSSGSCVNEPSESGCTPLSAAVLWENIDIVQIL